MTEAAARRAPARHARAAAWIGAHRAQVAGWLMLGALLCLALSAYAFRPQPRSLIHYRPTPGPRDYYDPLAPWLALLGALLATGALALRPPRPPRPAAARLGALPRPRWAALLVVPGALLLLIVAEANGQWLGVRALDPLRPPAQLALLLGGAALVGLGLAGLPRRRAGEVTPAPRAAPESRARLDHPALEITLIAALTILALGLRLWDLDERVQVMVDEGHFALGVNYVRAYPELNLLEPMPTAAAFPFLFSYGQAGAAAIFGRNFLGLRAFSALLGALTIPALYLLARQLYGRRTAVIAALVLLTFPPHLHYSRLGLNNIADPLFGTLALGLLALALRTGRRAAYVGAGLALGATQYFYEGGRLLYPALIAAWLATGFVLWRPRPSWRGVILLALAFVLVAFPVYYTLSGLDFPLFDRMDKTEFSDYYWSREREPDNFATRVHHFRHAALHYVNAPENTSFNSFLYYGGHHPLVQEWLAPLFLLGLVVVAWAWRAPGTLPLGWVLGVTLGNALLVESAVTARYVVAFPALALLIALGLRAALDRLWPARWPGARGVTLGLAAAIALGQGVYYFGPHLDLFETEVRAHVQSDADDALQRSAGFPPGTEIHIVAEKSLPELDAQRLMNFLADGLIVHVIKPEDFTPEYLDALDRSVDHAFYVPYASAPAVLLAERFGERPLGSTTNRAIPPQKVLMLYYLPKDGDQPSAVSHQLKKAVGG